MPFGFWVLGNLAAELVLFDHCVESQMPFGFWVLGNMDIREKVLLKILVSQMPFGFWVLGNKLLPFAGGRDLGVSNAFRLLGSGEQGSPSTRKPGSRSVSNAFRLLGSGEHDLKPNKPTKPTKCLKCLSAFGFWGTEYFYYSNTFFAAQSQMPFGFWVLGNSLFVRHSV